MRKSGNRRRNYFVDKKFQSNFIVKFCLLVLAGSLLTGVLTYIFTLQSTTVVFDKLQVVVKSTADFIMPVSLMVLVIVTALTSIVTVMMTMFISHRISGPLYKFSLELKKMQKGDLTSVVRIRSKDQFQETANDLEKMRIYYLENIRELKSILNKVKTDANSADDLDRAIEIMDAIKTEK